MQGRLAGKTALVTGASRGIGRATALLLSREGAKVCVNYSKSETDAEEVVRLIIKEGHEAIALGADVADRDQVSAMVKRVLVEFGKVDILVNNAGIVQHADVFSIREEELDRMFSVNVKGTIYCTQAVAEQMTKRRYGKIVNIASIAAHGTAFSGTTAYASTIAG